MSIDVYHNIVTNEELEILTNYYESDSDIESIDSRPDVFSKIPDIINGKWPKKCISSILNRVIDSYEIETILFYDSKAVFGLHVDSGDGNQETLHKNILIPIHCDGSCSTVVFENKWFGPSIKFDKVGNSPFTYKLPTKNNSFLQVDDIRKLSDISNFNITKKELDELIKIRSPNSKNPPETRTSDYSKICGYNPNKLFDKELHQKWLKHEPIENFHGLAIKKIIKWNPGDVIVFDRQYLHCAGFGHQKKRGISIFTIKKNGKIY